MYQTGGHDSFKELADLEIEECDFDFFDLDEDEGDFEDEDELPHCKGQ